MDLSQFLNAIKEKDSIDDISIIHMFAEYLENNYPNEMAKRRIIASLRQYRKDLHASLEKILKGWILHITQNPFS